MESLQGKPIIDCSENEIYNELRACNTEAASIFAEWTQNKIVIKRDVETSDKTKLQKMIDDVQGKGAMAEVSALYKLCEELETELTILKKGN